MTHPLFPSFILGGFECSTPINRDGRRVDEVALTQHDRYVADDYRMLRTAGIGAARDGVRWNLVDKRGRLDFSSVTPFIEASLREELVIVWDLFHYGYPDDLDPFDRSFIPRFADYCYGVARLLYRRGVTEPYLTPVNEISYLAWAAGDEGMFAPHCLGRGAELKRQLARASIVGMDAILTVSPGARFIHCEPLVHVTAPRDLPHLAGEADYFNHHFVHEAWDLLGGLKEPELGGSLRHLDIIGINYYGYNQWEHQRPHNVLAEEDPRRVPFSELLKRLHERYGRPMLVSETSSHGDLRPRWLQQIGQQCLNAIASGVDLHGLCIYPVIDMFDWHASHDHEPLNMGLWQLCRSPADPACLDRIPHRQTFEAMKTLEQQTCHLHAHQRAAV